MENKKSVGNDRLISLPVARLFANDNPNFSKRNKKQVKFAHVRIRLSSKQGVAEYLVALNKLLFLFLLRQKK